MQIIKKIHTSLVQSYDDSEISIFTRLIIEHVTNLPFSLFLSDKNTKITEAQELNIDKIIERLQRLEPIQYILGETEFFGLPFMVDDNVLIPRPETEELVEMMIHENSSDQVNILDIGTGSGCIAISLKRHIKKAKLVGWDVSESALEMAIKNAKLNSVDVTFSKVDVLSEYPTNEFFDVIVSNPPYIMNSEKKEMDHNVLNYEPHTALFVSDHEPLLFYNKIADIAKVILKPSGRLYFEINRAKGMETIDMLNNKGFVNIELFKDISGNDRIIKAIYLKK